MSWTVCHPPTVVSEHAVIHRDSCTSAQLSLSLSHNRIPPNSPLPSSDEPRKKPKSKGGTHTQTQPNSLNGVGERPHKVLDGENERWGRFWSLCEGFWQKMCIKGSPQALYNTLIIRKALCVHVCVCVCERESVINYLQALFLFLGEHYKSPNNKKQPVKSTYRAHILKTPRLPLHRLQL